MTPEVATLGEVLLTDVTLIWPLHGVFPEVISQVTTLSEDRLTAGVLATEVELGPLRLTVPYFNSLMPLIWNAFKVLDFARLTLCHGKFPDNVYIYELFVNSRLHLGRVGLHHVLAGSVLRRSSVLGRHRL